MAYLPVSVGAPKHQFVIVGFWLAGKASDQLSQLRGAHREHRLCVAPLHVGFFVRDLVAEPLRVEERDVQLAAGDANSQKHVTDRVLPANVSDTHAVDVNQMAIRTLRSRKAVACSEGSRYSDRLRA